MQQFILAIITVVVLSACNLQRNEATSVEQPPTHSDQPLLVQETINTPSSDTQPPATEPSQWRDIDAGLAWRTLIPDGNTLAQLHILRIDPDLYRFRAVYQVGEAKFLRDWQAMLPEAVAILNANFFERDNTIVGALVSDGIRFGNTFRDTGGTFVIENGVATIRSNATQPYQGQPVEQLVEGFPLLVQNGQSVHYSNNRAQRTRRTIIADDTDGNILIMVSPFLGLSLTDLSQYLPTTDLNIVNALNLDGGGSTMLSVEPADYSLGSFDPVPAILAIYPR